MKYIILIICFVVLFTDPSSAQVAGIASFEGFNYTQGTQLVGQGTGWGWSGPWQSIDNTGSYVVSSQTPFSYAVPATSAYYVTSGYLSGTNTQSAIIGRNFDTSPSGPYAAWIDAQGSLNTNYVGYVLFLIRKAANDDSQVYFGLSDGLTSANINAGASIGYFGTIKSNFSGKRYWTIRWPDGTFQRTSKEIVPGKTEFFMFCMANTATPGMRNILFGNDPTIQNGWNGGQLSGVIMPFKFKSVFFYGEDNNSLDEIRSTQINNLSQAVIYNPLFRFIGIDGL